jgi:sensor histidine kinase regulating citrate/malate metabolism
MFVIYKMESIATDNEKQALLNLEIQMTRQHAENISVMINQFHNLKHDYRHHLQTLKAMLDKHLYDSADNYFNEIACSFEESIQGFVLNHPIISTMLIKFADRARNEKINFKNRLFDEFDIVISEIDLNIILSNILENAFQAVMKIKNKERWITIDMLEHGNCVMIIIENDYQGTLIMDDGKLKTSKRDKKSHGYGLKSVESTIKKYNGTVDVNTENNVFSITLIVPKSN